VIFQRLHWTLSAVLLLAGTSFAQTTVPFISSLNPSSVTAGSGGFYLTVIGGNFQSGAFVSWNNSPLQTNFQSSGQLLAFVTQNLTTTPGSAFISVTNPGGIQSSSASFSIAAPPINILSTNLPSGMVGTAYAASLLATGGNPPYTWTATAGLPPGLTLNPNGNITGTPTASGSYTVSVRVTDSQSGAATRSFSLTITGLTITTASPLSPGTASLPYSLTLSATGGTPPYTWAASPGIPPGLTINPSTGVIAGTPSTAGSFSFTVQVTDSKGQAATQNYTLTINPAPLTITTVPPLFNGIVGTAYLQTFSASGGTPPYAWSITSGNAGNLTLDPNSGALQGTPQTAGTFTFTVQVTDKAGARVSSSFSVTITRPSLTIVTGASLPSGTVGAAYSQSFSVVGGTPPYTWSLSSGSVPGLTFAANQATLAGSPTAPGTFAFVLQAQDSGGLTVTRSFSVTINPATLTITTGTQLPDGTLGAPYSFQMSASGGVPPYTWSANGLPAGLTIDPNSGTISGTMGAAAPPPFAVTVSDSTKVATATNQFRINVNLPTVPSVNPSGLPATAGPAQQYGLQISIVSPYPVTILGTAILTFSPDVGGGDGTIQFSTGGTTASFTIPAGSTTATSAAPLAIQTGTVAGTINISLRLQAGGQDVTPTPAPATSAHVDQAAPVIQSVQVSRTASSLSIQITGYSTAREVTQAVFNFNAAQGQTLQTSQVTIPVDTLFSAWYQNSANNAYGSQFILTQPFSIQGDPSAVLPKTATLTNREGTTTYNIGQ